jgi:hypothetical protein
MINWPQSPLRNAYECGYKDCFHTVFLPHKERANISLWNIEYDYEVSNIEIIDYVRGFCENVVCMNSFSVYDSLSNTRFYFSFRGGFVELQEVSMETLIDGKQNGQVHVQAERIIDLSRNSMFISLLRSLISYRGNFFTSPEEFKEILLQELMLNYS